MTKELDRVARVRVLQIAFLALLVATTIVATYLMARSVDQARRAHRLDAETAAALIDATNDAHMVIEDYLRQRGSSSVAIPIGVFARIQSLGARMAVLSQQEQTRDPNSTSARAARAAQEQYNEGLEMARKALRGGDPRDESLMTDAWDGPVTNYFAALDRWSLAARARSEASLRHQDERVQTMIVWLGVLIAVLVGVGLIVYRWFGRVRDKLMNDFAEVAAEQAALRRVATSVAESDDPQAVFQTIAEEVAHLLGVEAGWLDEVERDQGTTRAEYVPEKWQHLARQRDPRTFVDDRSVRGTAIRTGAPARIADYRDAPGLIPDAALEAGIRSAVAAPITVEGRTWGVVVAMGSSPEQLPEGCEARLVPFARLAGVAIANARARALLAERASTDALTLLPNHGAFQQSLTEEVARAHSEGSALGLVIFDVDHFKQVNDTFGHPVGDRVLSEVARRMAALVRGGEMLARTGGEEFAWLLPGGTRDGARAAAERARNAVRDIPVEGVGVVTISAGVCTADLADDAHDLLAKADAALMAAKARGRDRTVVYERHGLGDDAPLRSGRFEKARALDALHALARAVDARHTDTVDHAHRVAEVAAAVAQAMGWERRRVDMIKDAALLHDVGRVGHPTAADDDQASHARLGAQLLADVLTAEQAAWVGAHEQPLTTSADDRGLYEGANILGAANIWDSLVNGDGARPALPVSQAMDRLRAMRGTRLDPQVVETLLANRALVEAGNR